ncbi:MAG: VOC family protein [Actinomycetota bacterium]
MLRGIHHITAITGDSPGNVDFYVRVMGLRMVKKTVNFDAPNIYHLYYADEAGRPGSVLTFFEYPGARPGRHGAGMIHTIRWGVGSATSLDFWERRLNGMGIQSIRPELQVLRFADPEGLGIELLVDPDGQLALVAEWPEIPQEHALRGFAGVRAYRSAGAGSDQSLRLLVDVLGFESDHRDYFLTGGPRRAKYTYDDDPGPGAQGAGTVHHIAWAVEPEEHESWRSLLQEFGAHPTPIIDRTYFQSIYFREPAGVLFEIATLGPGFQIDEPEEHLGESLMLPERYEHMRHQLEQVLTPLSNPRQPA